MFPLGFLHGPELIIVAGIALLIFGNRLPSVMRSLGKSVTEFKKGVSGIEDEIESAANAANETKPTPGPTP
jgi:sec-independent protein translocase protein TatA